MKNMSAEMFAYIISSCDKSILMVNKLYNYIRLNALVTERIYMAMLNETL